MARPDDGKDNATLSRFSALFHDNEARQSPSGDAERKPWIVNMLRRSQREEQPREALHSSWPQLDPGSSFNFSTTSAPHPGGDTSGGAAAWNTTPGATTATHEHTGWTTGYPEIPRSASHAQVRRVPTAAELQAKIMELERRLADEETRRLEQETAARNLARDLASERGRREAAEAEISAADKSMRHELAALGEELEDSRSKLVRALETMSQPVRDVQFSMTRLQEENERLKGSLEIETEGHTTQRSRVTQLEANLEAAAAELEQVRNTAHESEARLRSVTKDLLDANERLLGSEASAKAFALDRSGLEERAHEAEEASAEMEARLSSALRELEAKEDDIADVTAELDEKKDECAAIQQQLHEAQNSHRVAAINLEQAHETIRLRSREVEELESAIADLTVDLEELRGLREQLDGLGEIKLTARWVMVMRYQTLGGGVLPFEGDVSSTTVTRDTLDHVLDEKQLCTLLGIIRDNPLPPTVLGALRIVFCSECRLPKFTAPGTEHNPRYAMLNEFPLFPEHMADDDEEEAVCTKCRMADVERQLLNVAFPGSDAGIFGKAQHAGDVAIALRAMADRDMAAHLEMFDVSTRLRAALSAIRPVPSDLAFCISANLHRLMIQHGQMTSPFSPRFASNTPDDEGRVPPFNTGTVRMATVTRGAAQVAVPLLMRFFNRKAARTECAVCDQAFFDIEVGTEESWQAVGREYGGDWMWGLVHFPSPALMPGCQGHEMDTCRECLGMHLKTQLAEFGRTGVDRLGCPDPGCERRYEFDEVRRLAPPETFQQYDRYLALNRLSSEPGFMWCLREGCNSGEIYEEDDGDRVQCNACAFTMCFRHQTPWHGGITCAQYDNQQRYGDPDFENTQGWLRNNSKPCPRCRVQIQKAEGCHHMTCTQCRHEFCWVCLADWVRYPGCCR